MGALESVLGPLGVVLGRSWELLGLSWAILSRSWGILRRSWVALGGSWELLARSWGLLARSWAVLEGQESQKGSGPGGLADQGREVLPSPSDSTTLTPPLHSAKEGSVMRKTGLRTTGKREESEPQGRGKSQNHREDGRVEERPTPHAQWPRGPADIEGAKGSMGAKRRAVGIL